MKANGSLLLMNIKKLQASASEVERRDNNTQTPCEITIANVIS